MSVSYILEKKEFNLLWRTICDKPVPEMFAVEINSDEGAAVIEGLKNKGIMHLSSSCADIERTTLFLFTQAGSADRTEKYDDHTGMIFYCPKLIICVERDRLSMSRCCLTPLKDKEALDEFLADRDT